MKTYAMPTLLYLHGFLSSSASAKAQVTQQWITEHCPHWDFLCPNLPAAPSQTKKLLDRLLTQPNMKRDVVMIGSSLGGFWATYITERKGFPSVLVNPAISPHKRFGDLVGKPLKNYHSGEISVLQKSDIAVMEACDQPQIKNSDLYWLMVQTGDTVLDYRQAVERYQGCRQTVESGGTHAFEGYESWLSEIVEFLDLTRTLQQDFSY